MCKCLCSVIVLCGMMMKGREKVKPGADSQPALLEKHKGDEYLYSVREKVEVRVTKCNCLYSVIVLCGMMMKGSEKVKPGAGSQPALLEKHQGGRQV